MLDLTNEKLRDTYIAKLKESINELIEIRTELLTTSEYNVNALIQDRDRLAVEIQSLHQKNKQLERRVSEIESNYSNVLEVKDPNTVNYIQNMQNWLTIAQDDGAWDGVRDDWPTHNSKILEHVKRFDTVVQAGGHQGLYPRLLSDMFKFVYTFEPDPINFHCLVNNCQKDNIFKFNSALGDKHTMVCMNEPAKDLTTMKDNSGMNSIDVDKIGNTPQLMIDDLNLNSCDLIWLDIEGYEIRALTGAFNTIDKFTPVIIAERADENVRTYLSAWNYIQVDTSNLDCIFKAQ